MLARRFTIVCLLVTIFGMGLSILVAEKSRPSYAHNSHHAACDAGKLFSCALATQR